jgi:CheY-like chemotaxis protein
MPVLIIDPDKGSAEQARNAIGQIDRRIRIELAEDGAQAWPKAIKHRPYLVMCDPGLPDIHGGALCGKLARHLSQTTFISYTGQPEGEHHTVFHGVLRKPPDRFALLSLLSNASQRKKMPSLKFSARPKRESGVIAREHRPGIGEQIFISVSIVDDELSFKIGVPSGATLGMALRQIGKSRVAGFELLRNGVLQHALPQTLLQNGDSLRLKI